MRRNRIRIPPSDPVSVEQPVLPAAAGAVDPESGTPSAAGGEGPDLAVEYVSGGIVWDCTHEHG